MVLAEPLESVSQFDDDHLEEGEMDCHSPSMRNLIEYPNVKDMDLYDSENLSMQKEVEGIDILEERHICETAKASSSRPGRKSLKQKWEEEAQKSNQSSIKTYMTRSKGACPSLGRK